MELQKKLRGWMLFLLCLSGISHAIAQEVDTSADTLTVASEIVAMEAAFQKMTVEEGIAEAFRYFAAPDGVINRDNKIISGPEAIFAFYDQPKYRAARVTWKPDEVRVADCGDMAYSYGNFEWVAVTEQGENKVTGIYMTVWKKQDDGSWRYIWD